MKLKNINFHNFNAEPLLYIAKIVRIKLILVFVFMLGSFISFGQNKNTNVTSKKLSEVLYLSAFIRRNFMVENCGNDSCKEWYINNADNLFFRNDTLRIYNSAKILAFKEYHNCEFKVLKFLKPSKFSLRDINICHAQQSGLGKAESEAYARRFGSSDSAKKWFKDRSDSLEKLIIPHEYKIIEKAADVFLVFTRDNKILFSFKVSDSRNYKKSMFGKNSYEIILVREK
jgi:hypothetical protein